MRQDYTIPTLPPVRPALDMNGGFLCLWTYWRPDPAAPDPEMSGLKQQMVTYRAVAPTAACLCGSGRLYGWCCQRLPYWQPICPNLGCQGDSLLAPQTATFPGVDGAALYARLMDDIRLEYVEDTPERAFWILWGEPALESQYGIMCFGDLELQHRQKLIVTALSIPRMAVLLDLVAEVADVGTSGLTIERDPIPVFDKRTRERYLLPPENDTDRKRPGQRRKRR